MRRAIADRHQREMQSDLGDYSSVEIGAFGHIQGEVWFKLKRLDRLCAAMDSAPRNSAVDRLTSHERAILKGNPLPPFCVLAKYCIVILIHRLAAELKRE